MTDGREPKSSPRRDHLWTKDSRPVPPKSWSKDDSPGGVHGRLALQRKFEGKAGDQAMKRFLRRKSISVIHALSRIIADAEAPASVRVAAAQIFLDRGWGKVESDGAAPKRAKKNRPVVVVNNVPRSPFKKTGGV